MYLRVIDKNRLLVDSYALDLARDLMGKKVKNIDDVDRQLPLDAWWQIWQVNQIVSSNKSKLSSTHKVLFQMPQLPKIATWILLKKF